MVHADAIVGEISCQQKCFSHNFLRVKLTFSCYWWLVVNQHLRKGLDNFEDFENASDMVAETPESLKDHQSEKQHVRVHVCYRCKQHVHVHVQNLKFVISAEKATFQRLKCLAML